jgi:hypothetical protein
MSARVRLFRRHLRNRDGFAMFMALGALVIIGVLVAASSMITLQENRLGQNQLVQARAFAAAEYGLNRIQADWDRTPNLTMTNGQRFDTSYVLSEGNAAVHYVRLNDETFWIVSEGTAMVGNNVSLARQGRKRIGAILRLRIPTIKAEGAITVNGTVTVKGSVSVSGNNNIPPGWTGCDASAPAKAGVVIPTTSSTANIVESKIIDGSPKVSKSATASDASTYIAYGDENWSTLTGLANFQFLNGAVPDPAPAVNADGSCNRTLNTNWGEPLRSSGYVSACINFFPIIYATCTPFPTPPAKCEISLNGGRGQGILLIHGDARLNGQFEWYGLIVLSGDINKGNGAAKIHGGVMAANSDLDTSADSDFQGNATFKYSQCSLERAMRGSAQVVQAKERSWTELY